MTTTAPTATSTCPVWWCSLDADDRLHHWELDDVEGAILRLHIAELGPVQLVGTERRCGGEITVQIDHLELPDLEQAPTTLDDAERLEMAVHTAIAMWQAERGGLR